MAVKLGEFFNIPPDPFAGWKAAADSGKGSIRQS